MRQSPPAISVDASAVPTLGAELTCLHVSDPRSVAVHEIVLEAHSPTTQSFWVDSRNTASTYRLYEQARSDRQLSGLRIARAFTAYQHFSLCRSLLQQVTPDTELVCLPNLTSLYRDDDVPDHERDALLDAVLAGLDGLATTYEIPVVVSTSHDDAPTERVAAVADREITCETTPYGVRYDGDDIETTVYPVRGGWQTTIPYWVDLLGAVDDATLIEAAYETEFAGVA